MKTASLARVHDDAKSFNLFLVKSHLLWLPFQIKKSYMIWKIDGISFLNSRPDVKVGMKPREVKRSLRETLRRPRCRICVCASFEGFWTRFVMDRCREHLLRLWIDPTMPWCLLYYNRERRESARNNNENVLKMSPLSFNAALVEHPMTKACSACIMLRRRFFFSFFWHLIFCASSDQAQAKSVHGPDETWPSIPNGQVFFQWGVN